ncbi:MAG: hypothetical protein OXC60_04530 [Litoreibacter sp.]|nr:hypothetical protein [Litoreibacter sp.]
MLDATKTRDRRLKTLFVGFQDQDNLGLRYLMSAATKAGHETGIETYDRNPQSLLDRVLREKPDFIGFSYDDCPAGH